VLKGAVKLQLTCRNLAGHSDCCPVMVGWQERDPVYENLCHLSPEVFFRHGWRKKTEEELANAVCLIKWKWTWKVFEETFREEAIKCGQCQRGTCVQRRWSEYFRRMRHWTALLRDTSTSSARWHRELETCMSSSFSFSPCSCSVTVDNWSVQNISYIHTYKQIYIVPKLWKRIRGAGAGWLDSESRLEEVWL